MAKKKKSNDEESNQNLGNTGNADDTFGLPDIEYKPLDRTEEASTPVASEESVSSSFQTESEASTSSYEQPASTAEEKPYVRQYGYEEEETSVAPKVIAIVVVLLVAIGAAGYFMWYKPKMEKEAAEAKIKQEQEAKQKELDRIAAEAKRLQDEAERRRLDSLANIPKIGVVETLSAPTGRYYVVVASAIDGDLLMDNANKLKNNGISSKIIPPFGKHKFYRLAIADGDTFAAAQDVANAKKTEYGDATWVIKY